MVSPSQQLCPILPSTPPTCSSRCPSRVHRQLHGAQRHLCRPASPGGTPSYPLVTRSLGVLPQSAGATQGPFPTCFWKTRMTEKASHTAKPRGHLVPVALAQSPQSPKSLGTNAPKLVDTGDVSLSHWSATRPFGRDLSHQTCPNNKKNISAPESQYFRVPRLMATADPRSSDAEKTGIPHFTAGGGPACPTDSSPAREHGHRAPRHWSSSSSRKPSRAEFRKWKRARCHLGVESPQGKGTFCLQPLQSRNRAELAAHIQRAWGRHSQEK